MIALSEVQVALGLLSGSFVGFSLGLVGGGGSILAVPLMVYVVGVASPHAAIGTSAIGVAANAAVNLANHARSGHVKWPCAAVFAGAGVAGAFGGSTLGKMLDGQRLLLAFALLMLIVGALMLRKRGGHGDIAVTLNRNNFPMLAVLGLCTGVLSGFFGIGGRAGPYAGHWHADPECHRIVARCRNGIRPHDGGELRLFRLCRLAPCAPVCRRGVVGGLLGARLAKSLSNKRTALNNVFAGLIFGVSIYMIIRSLMLL